MWALLVWIQGWSGPKSLQRANKNQNLAKHWGMGPREHFKVYSVTFEIFENGCGPPLCGSRAVVSVFWLQILAGSAKNKHWQRKLAQQDGGAHTGNRARVVGHAGACARQLGYRCSVLRFWPLPRSLTSHPYYGKWTHWGLSPGPPAC